VDAIIRDIVASGDYMILLKPFYADGGALSCDTNNDTAKVQSRADAFKDRFERVGLEMNDIKTKVMIVGQHLIDFINKKARLIVNAPWRRFRVPALWFYVAETRTRTASVKARKTCERGRETLMTSQENPVNQPGDPCRTRDGGATTTGILMCLY
jgi:hypothetical protein